jgi:hypothetical protein
VPRLRALQDRVDVRGGELLDPKQMATVPHA